jgi:hypothetical protein
MVRFAILKGDKSIDDLTSRLFDLRANATRMRAQASDALKRANPSLSDLEKLPPGSVVVVPDQPGAAKAGETFSPTNLANMNVPQAVTDQVASFKGGLETVAKSATEQANATLALLKDRTVAAAAANDPDLVKQLSAVSDNAKTALKDAEVQSKTLQEGIAQLGQDLAGFLKLVSASFQPAAQPAQAPQPSAPTLQPSTQPSPKRTRNPLAQPPVPSQPLPAVRPAAPPQPVPRRSRSGEPQPFPPTPQDSDSPSAARPKPKTRRKK